jgi:BMFP domain-containing protein YqiC
MTEVIKDTFETRMKIRDFDAKIKKLEERVNEIEKKQAERFPHLIERLEELENRQNADMYNEQKDDPMIVSWGNDES